MGELYGELFRSFHQFHKLKICDLLPELSRNDFMTLVTINEKGNQGEITISELAGKMNVLPSAVSRTLRNLEEKELVTRSINKADRRNTYVELTEEGLKIVLDSQKTMSEFEKAVFNQLDEKDMKRLISYLNEIFELAQKEIEKRKIERSKENLNE